MKKGVRVITSKQRWLKKAASTLLAISFLSTGAISVSAQQTDEDASSGAGNLMIELNNVRQVDDACRLIFMATNNLGEDLSAISFETVLIDHNGVVDRLTVFDFQDLPDSRTRVRQFDLGNTMCSSIGQVLINGVANCQGEIADNAVCADALSVSSRTEVEISG